MSDINIEQTPLNITITPNTTQLTVFAGGFAQAQGNTTEVQYNNGGVLAGANGLTYNSGTQTTTAGNLTVTNNTDLGNIGNITISGGNSGEVLTTDGSGGLSFTEIANANFASFAGNIIEAAQPNITSVGNLSNLTVTGNVTANYFIGNGSQLTGLTDPSTIINGSSNVTVTANGNVRVNVSGNTDILVATSTGIVTTGANLGNVSNLKIIGGNNGQYLQTDGTGNLSWSNGGGTGNGVVGGSNTQIQYNNAGNFAGSPSFTFNNTSNTVTISGNLTANIIQNGNSNIRLDSNGNITISSTGISNILNVNSSNIDITGTTKLQQVTEKVTTNATGSTGTINFDLLTQAIIYKTANATGNFILNFRGNSTVSLNTMLANNQSITCAFLNTNGSTGYTLSNIQIDGSNRTVYWNGGVAPLVGTTNGIDMYTINIIKTNSNVFTIIGNEGSYS